jgi:hypothetical protein
VFRRLDIDKKDYNNGTEGYRTDIVKKMLANNIKPE